MLPTRSITPADLRLLVGVEPDTLRSGNEWIVAVVDAFRTESFAVTFADFKARGVDVGVL
jgi:hypothetical protein